MPEEPIWTGSPSQIKNLKPFIVYGLLALAILLFGVWLGGKPDMKGFPAGTITALSVVPMVLAVWKWLQTRAQKFSLTSERMLITNGIINVVTDSLELYRVKDIRMSEPLWLRLFGLENVELTTTEISAPFVRIDHIPKSLKLADKIRAQVETCRVTKGTREIEMQ